MYFYRRKSTVLTCDVVELSCAIGADPSVSQATLLDVL
jgi:hypothetical protein